MGQEMRCARVESLQAQAAASPSKAASIPPLRNTGNAASNAEPSTGGFQLRLDQVSMLVDIVKRFRQFARLGTTVVLCEDEDINAAAMSLGDSRSIVVISTGILELLQYDRDS